MYGGGILYEGCHEAIWYLGWIWTSGWHLLLWYVQCVASGNTAEDICSITPLYTPSECRHITDGRPASAAEHPPAHLPTAINVYTGDAQTGGTSNQLHTDDRFTVLVVEWARLKPESYFINKQKIYKNVLRLQNNWKRNIYRQNTRVWCSDILFDFLWHTTDVLTQGVWCNLDTQDVQY